MLELANAMLMSDSYLLNAGWLFIAAWSIMVVIVGIKAFGRDFFPSKAAGAESHGASMVRRTPRKA